ncbi:hypothetical protein E1A91_A01G041400v1 [Gossypium mustelinum]|uniref:Protein kinase domain-containing protein n=1 Tax=Gossypium mustelinum TaxID=34275 RepID=A0A5D3A9G5_GOSMU|nr:hypothetical protein E1A91_A01G041400v1 [Gossypium mustelinum]
MATLALFLLVFPGACLARHRYQDCGSVFCGNLNISYPLGLKNQPLHSGYHNLELECEKNNRTTLVLGKGKFFVQQIFYKNDSMGAVDASLDMDKEHDHINRAFFMKVLNCTKSIKLSTYVDAFRCTTKPNSSSPLSSYVYFLDQNTPPSDFNQFCTVEAEVPSMVDNIIGMSTQDIYNKLSEGIVVSWSTYNRCSYKRSFQDVYSFKEIIKMTRSFKEKLGEGGYGSVFKGKLRSGHHAAVKLLDMLKGNSQDFINEVASIGRIHHANMTKLTGFCVERSKQALVYDFMSNGSLDKIIFSKENTYTLGWKKIFDIVLGVAQGIDYLHQGCERQILHFDIKPHNILLDENFISKVSDFGLAKLYSVDDSFVSLTVARGTIGYIAPELIYKNLRGISYKADVYSFGMLLMEMVGRRKNVNAFADHTSQIYFPTWIYDRLDHGEDIEFGDVSDAEKVMVRKMIITTFWCIQLLSTNRPSMSKVLKMLETDVELLEMPPKPFYQLPLETSMEVHSGKNLNDETSTSLEIVTNDQF